MHEQIINLSGFQTSASRLLPDSIGNAPTIPDRLKARAAVAQSPGTVSQ